MAKLPVTQKGIDYLQAQHAHLLVDDIAEDKIKDENTSVKIFFTDENGATG